MKLLLSLFLFFCVFNSLTGTIDNFSTVGTLTYIQENCDFSFDETFELIQDFIDTYHDVKEEIDFETPEEFGDGFNEIISGDGNFFEKTWNTIKWFFSSAFDFILNLLQSLFSFIVLAGKLLIGVGLGVLVDLIEIFLSIFGVVFYLVGIPLTV